MKKILLFIASALLFISSCSKKDEVIEKNEEQSNELTVSGNLSEYISEENRLKMDIQGYAACYNALTGTYKKNRIYNDSTHPEVLAARWDLVHEEFGREVRKAINKALKTK